MILAFPFKQRILTIHDVYHFKKFKGIKGLLYDLFYFYLPIYFSHKIVAVSDSKSGIHNPNGLDIVKLIEPSEAPELLTGNPL